MDKLLYALIETNRNRAHFQMRMWIRDVGSEEQGERGAERTGEIGGELVHNVLYVCDRSCKLSCAAAKVTICKGPLAYQAKNMSSNDDRLKVLTYEAIKDIGVAVQPRHSIGD